MNDATREKVMQELEPEGILDVYWHRDRLYVINEYDLEDVRDLLEDLGLDSVVAVLADEMADLAAY